MAVKRPIKRLPYIYQGQVNPEKQVAGSGGATHIVGSSAQVQFGDFNSLVVEEDGVQVEAAIIGVDQTLKPNVAVSGTTTTIKFDDKYSDVNDDYNGMYLYITAGTNAGAYRLISDYVGSTRTATVSVALSSAIDDTSVFYLIEGVNVADATFTLGGKTEKGMNIAPGGTPVALTAGKYLPCKNVPFKIIEFAAASGTATLYSK